MLDETPPKPFLSLFSAGRVLGAALILSVVIAYLPAINAGFIWDDDLLLTNNTQLQTAHGLTEIWLGKNSYEFTPMTLTTYWIEKRLWGDTATGYHVVNLLLHAAAAILLWRILLVLRLPGAWLAALLFAIHPVNVASVAWIAERKNTLSAAFFFASILFFLTGRKRSDVKLQMVSIVLFLMAGLSKGSVVTLPVVLAGCILWMDRRVTSRDILWLVPFFVIASIISCLTIHYQEQAIDYGLPGFTLVSRAARAGYVPWLYLRELFLPIGLSPFSPVWQPDLRSPIVYLSPILILVMLALFLWRSRHWGRPLLFASGYYLWMLLPVLGVIWMFFQQETSCADWWQYLAAPGIFALVGGAIVIAIRRVPSRSARLGLHAALCVALVLLLVQTWRRCAIYESMESYCRAVLSENPQAWGLQDNLGLVLNKRGESDQAEACYRRALSVNPRTMKAHNNLGILLSAKGQLDEAEREFKAALRLQPMNGGVLANLSDLYFAQGRIQEALATNAEAIKADPSNPQHYVVFGVKLNVIKQFDRAAVCFRNALILSPGDPRIEIDLARTLLAAGRTDDATLVCDEAWQNAKESGNKSVMQAIAIVRNQCKSSGHR